ncbi:MAG: diguanylate cyclase [Sulfurospirillum sp.]|nr:diguanylate cyclase [Sulfurospirillum sp.]
MEKNKILIVEDNKALAKLIAKKMQKDPIFSIDIAHSLQEAKELIAVNRDYFLSLLDLNLPDAPNGEVVDFVLQKKIPVIVLTGNIDTQTREEILKKDIIDYVYKGNMDDVNYIFALVVRLWKNRTCKVMIVDDSIVTRNEVKKMLQTQMYQVFAAAHGEEALGYMQTNADMKLILTDYHMPVIDGFELTKQLRQTYTKNELGIIAMTAVTDEMLSSRFLKIGANDFINIPFTREELTCRVNNTVEYLEFIETISDMANTDFLTGLYNRRYFFKQMHEYDKIAKEQDLPYAIAMIDLDNFKTINDTYGHDLGDKVICACAQVLRENTKGSDIVARFGGEEFCIALKNIDKKTAVAFFVKLRMALSQTKVMLIDKEINFSASIGVAFDSDATIDEIIDHADMALYLAKKNGRNRVEISQE